MEGVAQNACGRPFNELELLNVGMPLSRRLVLEVELYPSGANAADVPATDDPRFNGFGV